MTKSVLTNNSSSRKQWQVATVVAIFIAVMGIDQWIKIWVKTHLWLHQHVHITDWFYILFTENNGMAFGMEIFDKIFLTGFRLVAVAFVGWYICRLIRRGTSWGYLLCMVFIMAGAAGNIIDCLFYGLVFNNPAPPEVAQFVPWGTGYAELFYGRVVDMFYFPLVEWDWPAWIPLVGGNHFIFFSPIFNFADASISCGVIVLLLFYSRTLAREMND